VRHRHEDSLRLGRVLDPQFVADCPYAAEAILFDEILELVLECRVTRVRRIRGSIYARYAFRFEQEGTLVYESEQGAVWSRTAGKD
jgi:hypothetical protein